jgi:tetratricopeptide (TPR) repeat protein
MKKTGLITSLAFTVALFLGGFTLTVYLLVEFIDGRHSFWIGYAAMNRGNYDGGIRDFDRTLSRPMTRWWQAYALLNRAYCFQQLGRNNEAIRDYSASLKLKPELAFALQQRGFLHDAAGQPDLAFADYSAALRVDPNLAEAWRRCGLYEIKRHEYGRAKADFREAIRSSPDFQAAYTGEGYACAHLGDYDGALSSFDTAINLNPRDAVAYAGRGEFRLLNYEFVESLADLTQAARLAPRDPDILYARALLFYQMEDYEKAVEELNEILRLHPRNENALQRKGLAYRQLKDYPHAIETFTRLIEVSQGSGAYNDRARTYAKGGQYSLAQADYKQADKVAEKLKPHSKRMSWFLATCPEEKFRNGAEAIRRAFKECDASQWWDSDDLDTLAAACAEVGRFDDAVHYESRALRLSDAELEWQILLNIRLALFQNHQPYRDPPGT